MLNGINEMCEVINAETPKPQSKENELLEEIKRLRGMLTKQPDDVLTANQDVENETETPSETEIPSETETLQET